MYEPDLRASVNGRLPTFARHFHLRPIDVWALSFEQFLLFCEDLEMNAKPIEEFDRRRR